MFCSYIPASASRPSQPLSTAWRLIPERHLGRLGRLTMAPRSRALPLAGAVGRWAYAASRCCSKHGACEDGRQPALLHCGSTRRPSPLPTCCAAQRAFVKQEEKVNILKIFGIFLSLQRPARNVTFACPHVRRTFRRANVTLCGRIAKDKK